MIKLNLMFCCISWLFIYLVICNYYIWVEIIIYCYVIMIMIDFVMFNFGLLIKNWRIGGCIVVWVY